MFKNIRLVLFSFLVLSFWSCEDDIGITVPAQPASGLSAENQYFLDISFGNEFGPDYTNLRKWGQDLRIFVPDTTYPELMAEFRTVMAEINGLSSTIKLRQVDSEAESNYIMYFGKPEVYVAEYEPAAASFVSANYGLFYIYWQSYEIYKGSMYVDVFRTNGISCQKHLLREELTQSLGLMNDTDEYPNSIFFQQWTCLTQYASIDTVLIDYMLRDELKPGMTEAQVTNIIKQWQ